MFLKCSTRRKDGKIHRSWSVVESRRVVQKHVLYLGKVTDRQRRSWAQAVSVMDETSGECRQLSLIPEDRTISERAEAALAQMRAGDPPLHYLVGTPKARLNRLEAALAERPWVEVRGQLRVKCVSEDGEVYVLTEYACYGRTRCCS